MSIPLPTYFAGDYFVEQFTVYDTVSTKVSGRWTDIADPDRVISGVIRTDKNKVVNLDDDGALSQGSLILHTRTDLSLNDLTQNGTNNRQTYIRYGGEVWKLNTSTDWITKTGVYYLYFMGKYVNIGTSI